MGRLGRSTTIALALAVIATGCGRGTPSSDSTPRQRGTSARLTTSARPIPKAPISGRVSHEAVWTGQEMLVWGGREADDPITAIRKEPVVDGAAYNPTSNTWRRIAPAPLAPRDAVASVWTGREMVLWGGGNHTGQKWNVLADGASYDPESDTWTLLPEPPVGARAGADAIWTGTELLVWSGNPGNATEHRKHDGAAFDPASRRWRPIPAAPLPDFYEHMSVWTGSELVVFVGTFDERNAEVVGAAYDPVSDSWRRLPASGIAKGSFEQPVWDGSRILLLSRQSEMIDGGEVNPFPKPLAPAGAYVPATNSWESIEFAPSAFGGGPIVWTGELAVMWSGDPLGGLAFDAPRRSWMKVPAYAGPHREFPSAVWSGKEVLVWGGHNIPRFANGSHGDGPLRPLADGVALSLTVGADTP